MLQDEVCLTEGDNPLDCNAKAGRHLVFGVTPITVDAAVSLEMNFSDCIQSNAL